MGPRTRTVFDALQDQWDGLVLSSQLRGRIRRWATTRPVLGAYRDGRGLVEDGARDRDVLEAVAHFAAGDSVAMTATLVALLPRLAYLSNIGGAGRSRTGESALDYDERCAMVVSIGYEVVLQCRPGDGSTTWYDRRLWSNISKRYRRWVDRQEASVDAAAERLGAMSVTGTDQGIGGDVGRQLVEAFTTNDAGWGDSDAGLVGLCEWVADRAAVDLGTARLIVLTRAGGVPVESLVGTEGASAASIRQRRLRAEQRLATAVA